jgi:hypothetical protein
MPMYPLQLIPVLVTRGTAGEHSSMHCDTCLRSNQPRVSGSTGMGSGLLKPDAVTFRPTGERPLALATRCSWEVAVAHCLHLVSARHAQQTLQHNAAPVCNTVSAGEAASPTTTSGWNSTHTWRKAPPPWQEAHPACAALPLQVRCGWPVAWPSRSLVPQECYIGDYISCIYFFYLYILYILYAYYLYISWIIDCLCIISIYPVYIVCLLFLSCVTHTSVYTVCVLILFCVTHTPVFSVCALFLFWVTHTLYILSVYDFYSMWRIHMYFLSVWRIHLWYCLYDFILHLPRTKSRMISILCIWATPAFFLAVLFLFCATHTPVFLYILSVYYFYSVTQPNPTTNQTNQPYSNLPTILKSYNQIMIFQPYSSTLCLLLTTMPQQQQHNQPSNHPIIQPPPNQSNQPLINTDTSLPLLLRAPLDIFFL